MEIITPSDLKPVSIERLLKRYGSGRHRQKMEPFYRKVLAEAERLAAPTAIFDEVQLPAESIGVTLDENLVMTPRQSTSLIISVIDRT